MWLRAGWRGLLAPQVLQRCLNTALFNAALRTRAKNIGRNRASAKGRARSPRRAELWGLRAVRPGSPPARASLWGPTATPRRAAALIPGRAEPEAGRCPLPPRGGAALPPPCPPPAGRWPRGAPCARGVCAGRAGPGAPRGAESGAGGGSAAPCGGSRDGRRRGEGCRSREVRPHRPGRAAPIGGVRRCPVSRAGNRGALSRSSCFLAVREVGVGIGFLNIVVKSGNCRDWCRSVSEAAFRGRSERSAATPRLAGGSSPRRPCPALPPGAEGSGGCHGGGGRGRAPPCSAPRCWGCVASCRAAWDRESGSSVALISPQQPGVAAGS